MPSQPWNPTVVAAARTAFAERFPEVAALAGFDDTQVSPQSYTLCYTPGTPAAAAASALAADLSFVYFEHAGHRYAMPLRFAPYRPVRTRQ